MMQKIKDGNGFIAALDQSGGSTPKALQGYGYRGDEWSNDEEMFGLIHQMRTRIITAPSFGSGKVIGAILFERTMDGTIDGKPVPQVLIERGIVPFIKIDKGLEAEENGVQMMKPMPELTGLLERAKQLGVFGTKERSVINAANEAGIAVARRPAVRGRQAGPRAWPGADHRARSEHQERRPRDERPLAAGGAARRAGRDSRRAAGDAEAVDPGGGRSVRAAGRASQGASRGRVVGRLFAAPKLAASWPGTPA